MNPQLQLIIKRLKNPSVILSLVSQVITILLLIGVKINENTVMTVATAACSIFITLGIISNPDSTKVGYGDDILPCALTGENQQHVQINGKMVCVTSGAVYNPASEPAPKPAGEDSENKHA